MVKSKNREWLLIFYTVPSRPVSNRMKIWRKLAKAGAVPLKDAVYILPASDEHYEFFQWLVEEVKSMGGDGAFVKSSEIMTMEDAAIRDLFLQHAEREYRNLEKSLDVLERKVQSVRKGTKMPARDPFAGMSARLSRELSEMRKRDFFQSPSGAVMQKRLQAIETGRRGLGRSAQATAEPIAPKRISQYKSRIWVTRKKPFVDRMASAWLIRKFIDKDAVFKFIEERDLNGLNGRTVSFDMQNAEFTHAGDLCTFEVLIKSFGIEDKTVRKMAEIVHDLDVKDDKYEIAEAPGVENILRGIGKTAKQDADALEQGMAVFEMVYQSLAR